MWKPKAMVARSDMLHGSDCRTDIATVLKAVSNAAGDKTNRGEDQQ